MVVIAAGALAIPASAQASWILQECRATELRGAKICLYRDNADNNLAQGRYINNSSIDLETNGVFKRRDRYQEIYCARTVTRAGTTSRCTRRLARGTYYLLANTWRRDQFLFSTFTRDYRFGF